MSLAACEIVATPPAAASGEVRAGSTRILALDGLRGLAVLVVIAKHYGIYHWPGTAGTFASDLVTWVFPELYATDLFLVLTGYLLAGRLLDSLDKPGYYSNFYWRRLCRTFPPYYVLLLCFAAGVLTADLLAPYLWLDLNWPFGTVWSMPAYMTFMQSFWILAKGSLGPDWLSITWMLAVQEQFYLLLPLLLHWTRQRNLGYVFVGLFLAAPLCRWLVWTALPAGERFGYDCLIICRCDTLAIGVLAAWLLRSAGIQQAVIGLRRLLCPVATSLFLGLAWAAYNGYNWSDPIWFVLGHSYRALLYLFLVLVACFASDGLVGAVLRNSVLCELGRISYGLFLFHQMIRDLLFRVMLGMPPHLNSWETWLATGEAFLVTVLVAELCWHYLEKPLIAWSKSRLS